MASSRGKTKVNDDADSAETGTPSSMASSRGKTKVNDDADSAEAGTASSNECQGEKATMMRTLVTIIDALSLPFLDDRICDLPHLPRNFVGPRGLGYNNRLSLLVLVIAELENQLPRVVALIDNVAALCDVAARCRIICYSSIISPRGIHASDETRKEKCAARPRGPITYT